MGSHAVESTPMIRASNQLDEFLATDEPLTALSSGRLTDPVANGPVTIGLTDRRLVCASPDGEFVDVRYDSIASIVTRPRTRSTVDGLDDRIAIGAGWLLASLAFVGFVALAGRTGGPNGHLAALCAFVTSLAAVAAVSLNRQRDADPFDGHGDNDPSLQTALAGGVGGLAFLAASVFAGSFAAPILLFGMLAGVALVDYGDNHRGQFDGLELIHHREQAISVNTVDGRSVRLTVDPEEAIGQELSRLTNGTARDTDIASIPTRTDRV